MYKSISFEDGPICKYAVFQFNFLLIIIVFAGSTKHIFSWLDNQNFVLLCQKVYFLDSIVNVLRGLFIKNFKVNEMSSNLKNKILEILKKSGLAALATINEQGKPWTRYVIVAVANDVTIRCATFMQARKVQHIRANSEVHLVAGVPDMTVQNNYLQIQGKAEIVTDQAEKKSFWNDSMRAYFSGPDDPNYGVVVIKPYRIELWNGMRPEIWEV